MCFTLKPCQSGAAPATVNEDASDPLCHTAWEGDALQVTVKTAAPREPGDRPATPREQTRGGRALFKLCVPARGVFMRPVHPLTDQREAPCRSSAAPTTAPPAPPRP